MEIESMWRKFESLPPAAQKQVMDFVDLLQSRYASLKSRAKSGRPALREEEFVGIWKNREDMADSSRWVRDLRQKEWKK